MNVRLRLSLSHSRALLSPQEPSSACSGGFAPPTRRASRVSQSLSGFGAVQRRRLEQARRRSVVLARPVAKAARDGSVRDGASDLVHDLPRLQFRLGGMGRCLGRVQFERRLILKVCA